MAKNPRKDRNWESPIRQSLVGVDFGLTLARIQWDAFASMTFAGKVPRTQIAYGLAYRWLQETAKICGVPYNRLLIALRGEFGEETGRFHFHCLVGGTATRNDHALCYRLEHLWKSMTGVPALVAAKLLRPLGNPAQNSTKFFATSDVLECAKDKNWLVRVTVAINQHWQKQNAKRKSHFANESQNGFALVVTS